MTNTIIFPLDKKELIFNYGYKFEIKSIKKKFNNIFITINRKKNSSYKHQHYKMVLFYDDIPSYVNFEAVEDYIRAQHEELMCAAWVDSNNIEYIWVIHGPYEGWIDDE